MIKQYVNQHGRIITLGHKIGTGGEGTVYEIAGAVDLVAKIYHRQASSEKATKLSAMAQLVTPDILKVAAWPEATLHQSRGGATYGIVLPRIKNSNEIHELYSPAHRKVYFPRADLKFLIRAALNCASAFATLHDHNIVIGDVNQGNVFVSQQAIVSLIDCDSFQVPANGRLYRCQVGVAHFVPPELQDAHLPNITRTTNHDNFGLAIMIFHLLFMGRHPFAGRYSGPGDMPIENAISDYRFAYGSSASQQQMAPPPFSLTLAEFPHEIRSLLERAFAKGSEHNHARPTSHTWAHALERLEHHLCQCQDDIGHFYATHLNSCPWCRVVQNGGPNFFIAVSYHALIARSESFDLGVIWAKIQAVPSLAKVIKPPKQFSGKGVIPKRIPAQMHENRSVRKIVGIIVAASGILTLLSYVANFLIVVNFSIPIGIVFAIWWLVLKSSSPMWQLKSSRRIIFQNKKRELRRSLDNRNAVTKRYIKKFQDKIDSLSQLRDNYEQLRANRAADFRNLERDIKKRQMSDHLKKCFISDENENIRYIGYGRIATLHSYGIETAYDIQERTVATLPGFGDKTTGSLLDWRIKKENEFRFNPQKGIPQADIQAIKMKYAQKQLQLHRHFLHAPHELQQISNAAMAEIERLDSLMVFLKFEVAQAEADFRECSTIPWW